jgi:hypothetical protein
MPKNTRPSPISISPPKRTRSRRPVVIMKKPRATMGRPMLVTLKAMI